MQIQIIVLTDNWQINDLLSRSLSFEVLWSINGNHIVRILKPIKNSRQKYFEFLGKEV